MPGEFEDFTPDCFLDEVEAALGTGLGGYAAALPSYVNRVYELETVGRDRVVAKFYRPGRWSREAILEEHAFVLECADDELPVVPPVRLAGGSTLGDADGVPFAVYPKRRGRESEFESGESLRRVGALIAMIHAVGARRRSFHRVEMTPVAFASPALDRLYESDAVHSSSAREFEDVCETVIEMSEGLFRSFGGDFIRLHGDFHRGNVLDRPDEGLIAIDFDDMAVGPQVQDLWLLLPETPSKCPAETESLLEGYTRFVDFDRASLRLVEPLRAMRMMHFLSWCAMQSGDARFRDNFPDWGSESFWRRETADMKRQLEAVRLESRKF